MCLAVEVQPADYSTAEVQQPRNFYRLAESVSKGLRKCERPLTGGMFQNTCVFRSPPRKFE